ncbi:MAG: helix-turn-helix transcriptional regulator [Oscillospiraceae bacterium]|nr:helix-turn-helix transcriptional regulator [Oscillospiraceae bacterium]
MLLQNLALYEDEYYIRVNCEGDSLFYFFDYDKRHADNNMQFQHFHTFYELCVVLCPHATHFLEGNPYRLQMFDIVGIPPNVLHRTYYPVGEACKRLIIQFCLPRNVTGLSNEYEQLSGVFHREVPIFRFDPDLQKRVYRKLNDIFLLANKTDPMRDLIIHLKFIEFLTLLYLNQDQNRYSNQTEMSPMEQKIYSITGYIHTHYTEDLSLESLAQQFYISSCYLSRQFKEVTGFTLTDYIQMTRVRNVQALLINSRTPITEAASACGFASFSQFNRVFQKHIGMSPSQYRKENQTPATELDL